MAMLIIPLIFLLFQSHPIYGQEDDNVRGEPGKSPQAKAFDMKALDQLKTMTPEDLASYGMKRIKSAAFDQAFHYPPVDPLQINPLTEFI